MEYTEEDFRFDIEVVRIALSRGTTAPDGVEWVKALIEGIASGTVQWNGNNVRLGASRGAQFSSAVSMFGLHSEEEWLQWFERVPLTIHVVGGQLWIPTPASEG